MSQPRTIAFFSSSQLFFPHTPAANCLCPVLRGLQSRGFRVTFFHADDIETVRDPGDQFLASIPITPYRTDTDQAILSALEQAADADIIIRASEGSFDERLDRWMFQIARPRTQVVFWDFNPSKTLQRVCANRDDQFRALIPKYDLVLTCGGGSQVCDTYLKLGARHCLGAYDGLETHDMLEHRVRELEVILRPASLQPLPA